MSIRQTDEISGPRSDRVNWQINEFCAAHRIGRTLFYREVRDGEVFMRMNFSRQLAAKGLLWAAQGWWPGNWSRDGRLDLAPVVAVCGLAVVLEEMLR